MAACANCGRDNPDGNRFCAWCGQPLATPCRVCGADTIPGAPFCGSCGSPLTGDVPAASSRREPAVPEVPVAERRLVSILFADLVGFTSLSESRDAEDVRELLTRYFEVARLTVERYGGTTEKFIGDAVMALWGAPAAREDDAERAVRAALDLVNGVAALAADWGVPQLQARAGVVTGEAAVNLGAQGQGMVAGDLVNTASRVQSAAEPGSVLVTDRTRRATEAAVAYQPAGDRELKGKAEPVSLWRANRVIAGMGGAYRSTGLEAPFVGRNRQLRALKELFHQSADEGRAHLVTVTGIAGIGKSRLSWEFFKYLEGLAGLSLWHRGRSLAYGDGVTYWALAEMVKMRCRITEGEDPASSLAKLQAVTAEYLSDPEERRWVEPRLAHLLGLEEREGADREDLFAAWRVFFERLADVAPTVLVFEDLQWADRALLDFVDYLVEWSGAHPLFVLGLARPEIVERAPGWGAARRNSTSLYLEPLSAESMRELLDGLVPGLPAKVLDAILSRSEGVPLYAVETVRMLIDRGLLVQGEGVYQPVGSIEALDVPETLHALVAARLDGLSAEERRVVQHASVLGKSFTRAGLAATTGLSDVDLEPMLGGLVRKEIFGTQVDPRSPERGQYAFLQDLVKRIAYDTLARKERKALHLAVAEHLERSWGGDEDEVVEILASHYVRAFELLPDAPDAVEIRGRARGRLAAAGRRAASLAASVDAQRYFEQALELADEPVERAELSEQAGDMARRAGKNAEADAHFERSIGLFREAGKVHASARVDARLAEVLWDEGRLGEAVDRMERAYAVLAEDEPDADLATLAAQLARFEFFAGRADEAERCIEEALEMAESLRLPDVLSAALNTKAVVLGRSGRYEESMALLRRALEIALEHELYGAALRAYTNLSATMVEGTGRSDEAIRYALDGLAMARRVGIRNWEWSLLAHVTAHTWQMGRWDEAESWFAQFPSPEEAPGAAFGITWARPFPVHIAANRGEIERALALLDEFLTMPQATADAQNRGTAAWIRAVVLRAQGRWDEAYQMSMEAVGVREEAGATLSAVQQAAALAMDSAFELGDLGKVQQLLAAIESWPRREVMPYLRAQVARMSARLAAAQGHDDVVEPLFRTGVAGLRAVVMPFDLAEALADYGAWLASEGRAGDAEAVLAESRGIFTSLRATPWLKRLDAIDARAPAASGM